MKKLIIFLFAFLVSCLANAQFEQKVSLNFSVGGFKTFGKAMGTDDPMQMPHYRPGFTAGTELQYNMNRRLSVMINAGFMYSGSWYYKIGEGNYLHYTITNSTDLVVAEGENKLNFLNFSIGVVPKFYLFTIKKWNPYIFAGIDINFTRANYTDNIWKDAKRLDMLPPDDTGPYSPFLEKNRGVGFLTGIGVGYNPAEKVSIFIESGYNEIMLHKENFKRTDLVENLNAIFFRTGIRLSFLKSKNL
jgi:opacity protein-like surface antigen